MKTQELPSGTEIHITRIIDAPRERVWRALTTPQEIDRWWGPNGFRNVTQTWDFKPEGLWKHVMIGPDGSEYQNTTKFLEIVEPDHITYANAGGKKGEKGVHFRMTFSLKALGPSKTEVTIHHVFDTREERDFVVERYGAVEGGKQTLGRLAEHATKSVNTKPGFELVMERLIDAPRQRVWDAWAKPEHMARWFAPKPYALVVKKMDFRTGGSFSMAMRAPDGQEHAFSGRYLEIIPPKTLCWTGEFPNDPFDNIRTEVSFEEQGPRTKIHVRQTFARLTPVNEQATKGAKMGWTMTLNQLETFCGGEPRKRLQVKRRFDASPERVFAAWIDPAQVRKWLFSTPTGEIVRCQVDARPGGAFTIVDRRDGEDIEHVGTYMAVEPPRLLAFSFSVPKFSKEETLVSVEIAPAGTGCELTLTHEGVLPEWADRTQEGWGKLLEALASVAS